jgi:hypothetical protein
MATQLVMYEEEFLKINAVCDRLTKDANAKVVFLVDKNGQLISASGQTQNTIPPRSRHSPPATWRRWAGWRS